MGWGRKFVGMLAALAAFGAAYAAAPPRAAAQTLEQVQSFNEWAVRFQHIVSTLVTPMQQLPEPPSAEMSRAERRAWAETARTWAASAQTSFAAARSELHALPPPPLANGVMSERLRTAVDGARLRLEESLDASDRVVSAHMELADAVERNQMERVNSIRVTAIEAAMIVMRMFQDTNATQSAAMMEGNPQRPLAQSYALSYEALWALLSYKRDLFGGGQGNRAATADAIAAAAQQMRAMVAAGRSDLTAVQAQLRNPIGIDPRLVSRLQAVASTYPASFVREEEIAADLEAIVALLRDPRDIAEIEPVLDQRVEAVATRDAARGEDINRRTAIMTAP